MNSIEDYSTTEYVSGSSASVVRFHAPGPLVQPKPPPCPCHQPQPPPQKVIGQLGPGLHLGAGIGLRVGPSPPREMGQRGPGGQQRPFGIGLGF